MSKRKLVVSEGHRVLPRCPECYFDTWVTYLGDVGIAGKLGGRYECKRPMAMTMGFVDDGCNIEFFVPYQTRFLVDQMISEVKKRVESFEL